MESLKNFWEEAKSFFKYSETIFIARLTMLGGLITSAVGSLDWSPLLSLDMSTGFNKTQVIWLGAVTFVKGLIDEIARRRNATFKTAT